jgi:hypothetical protein
LRFVSESRLPVNVTVRRADRPGMIDLELELVSENPSWITVLKAYQTAQEELAVQQAEAAAKSAQAKKSTSSPNVANESETSLDDTHPIHADEEAAVKEPAQAGEAAKKRASRWIQRITRLPGIEADALSKIHGRLIAYDLLKCDLAGRSDGMVYQLTSSGKTILSRFGDETVEAESRSAA